MILWHHIYFFLYIYFYFLNSNLTRPESVALVENSKNPSIASFKQNEAADPLSQICDIQKYSTMIVLLSEKLNGYLHYL